MSNLDLNDDEPILPPALREESTGDWSALKGSAYHMLVALYLMLTNNRDITFCAGNDLRSIVNTQSLPSSKTGISVQNDNYVEWIQVKNENKPWTLNKILNDNTLLSTFIYNALLSQSNGQSWKVSLIASTQIRSEEISKFLDSFRKGSSTNSPDSKRFLNIITSVEQGWNDWSCNLEENYTIDHNDIVEVGFQVLNQIAACEQLPGAQIKLAIENKLLLLHPDEQTVRLIVCAIVGVFQNIGLHNTAALTSFTLASLQEAIGYSLTPRYLIPPQTIEACNKQVADVLPSTWIAEEYVKRTDIDHALQEFYTSDRCLFILLGDSGSGKSWVGYNEAQITLDGHVRLLLRGSILNQYDSLVKIIYQTLKEWASPAINEEELFRFVHGASADPTRGPFLLIVDDLPLSDDPALFAQKLETMCKEAKRRGIKLLLTTHSGVWQRISRGNLLAAYIFNHNIIFEPKHGNASLPQYSYELNKFTDDELLAYLKHKMLIHDAQQMAFRLRDPLFSVLRNPYLLSVYVMQSSGDEFGNVTIDIDEIIDKEADSLFRKVLHQLNWEEDELENIQKHLITSLWDSRRNGKKASELLHEVNDITGKSGRISFQTLQAVSLLTPPQDLKTPLGTVTWLNPQLGDRLTALWLAEQYKNYPDVISEMEPGIDDGVMTAIIRKAIDITISDPIEFADRIMSRDSNWLGAVVKGLGMRMAIAYEESSQQRQSNWRIIAYINALANREETYAISNTMTVLGTTAAYSKQAKQCIANLYHDKLELQAFKGQVALGSALEVMPAWTMRHILIRLRNDLLLSNDFSSTDAAYYRIKRLKGALQPLLSINHKTAASVAKRVLEWFQKRYVPPLIPDDIDVRLNISDILDAIRGLIALHENEADIETLKQHLSSDDKKVRKGAALSLLSIAEKKPELVKKSIFRQARVEREVTGYISRLLYFYTESCPEEVVSIIQEADMLHNRASSIALMLLSHIAKSHSVYVTEILPRQLNNMPGYARSIIHEILAFAWWMCCLASSEQCRDVLAQLSTPHYDDVKNEYRAFATYSASVALLARIGLDIEGMTEAASKAPIYMHHLAFETGFNFLYVDLKQTCMKYADKIVAHTYFPNWCELLCQTAIDYAEHTIHPITEAESEWQHRVANLAIDWICACAPYINNPDDVMTALPSAWPKLRFCNALVMAGCASQNCIESASQICIQYMNTEGSMSDDRDQLIITLRRNGKLSNALRYAIDNKISIMASKSGNIDALIHDESDNILEILHENIIPSNALPMLWEWSSIAKNWRSVLLSQVFRASFLAMPFSLDMCYSYCDQVIAVLEELPDKDIVREYKTVYTSLRAFCNKEQRPIRLDVYQSDILGESHKAAMAVIEAFFSKDGALNKEWFYQLIHSGYGWIYDCKHQFNDGEISYTFGTPAEIIYIPPAYRIALSLASIHSHNDDFSTIWMLEQNKIHNWLYNVTGKYFIDGSYRGLKKSYQSDILSQGLQEAEKLSAEMPWDVRVIATYGMLLLLNSQYEISKQILIKCLTMNWYNPIDIVNARYNLACCYARLGEVEQCRMELEMCANVYPNMNRQQVENDDDLISVKDEIWFMNIVRSLPDYPR